MVAVNYIVNSVLMASRKPAVEAKVMLLEHFLGFLRCCFISVER